ncbi:hypothetical protein TcCL_ESM08925 [Trypanosoma cruzi]|nr:hypothetical protein TcCL_ESM08925 [Trypanosoma cruzi]
MHGQRHRFRVGKGAQILVIMETCVAFVLIGVAEPEYLPEREKIGFQLDGRIFRWCTNAKVCFTTVSVPYFHIMEADVGEAWDNCFARIQLHTMTVSNRKGLRIVMERTSLCDRP